jgi:hypothetical protein
VSKKHTIESIRKTLTNVKIPKDKIKTKKGAFGEYIEWTYALGELLKNYPEARWEFVQYEQADGTMLDVQYYKDGSCSVECNIWIGDVKMHMWLPVTNHSNKPVGDCFSINTAKMRCLTKCIAVCFGLGAEVYKMDMLDEINEGGVGDSSNESPIPKSTPTIKPPSTFTPEPDAPPRLRGSDKIVVGFRKGTTYAEGFGNNLEDVRKDIKFWKPKTNLNNDQQLHLNTLIALEKHIIKEQEKAFKS